MGKKRSEWIPNDEKRAQSTNEYKAYKWHTERRDSGIHSFLEKTCYCSKSLQMKRQNVKISSNQNGLEEKILKLFQANVQKCVV